MLTTVAALAVAATTLPVSAAPKPAAKPAPVAPKPPPVASITVTAACNGDCHIILVEGRIDSAAAKRFREAVENNKVQRAVIVLNSNGGAAMDGLEIGELVRERGFSTYLRKGDVCASACAFIWAAGSIQYFPSEGGSSVGFHGAYLLDVNKNGIPVKGAKPEASPAGNAVVGAYLWQLGYGYAAIRELTKSAPDEMLWLTSSDQVKELGFHHKYYPTGGDLGAIAAGQNYSVVTKNK